MGIFRLIISILFPPVGLFLNYILGAETKLEKAALIISIVLSAGILLLIILFFVVIGGSNKGDRDAKRCESPYYCEPSDGEYRTCYYCRDKICNDLGKISCPNNGDDMFNYKTVEDPNDE